MKSYLSPDLLASLALGPVPAPLTRRITLRPFFEEEFAPLVTLYYLRKQQLYNLQDQRIPFSTVPIALTFRQDCSLVILCADVTLRDTYDELCPVHQYPEWMFRTDYTEKIVRFHAS